MASTYGTVLKHGKAIMKKTAPFRTGPSNKNLKPTRSPAPGGEAAATLARKGKIKGPDQGTG